MSRFSNQCWAYGSSLKAATSWKPQERVQADRGVEGRVGVQAHDLAAVPGGCRLQLGQQSAAEPETPGVGCDPHELDLRRRPGRQLQAGAADGLAVQAGDEEQALRRGKFRGVG